MLSELFPSKLVFPHHKTTRPQAAPGVACKCGGRTRKDVLPKNIPTYRRTLSRLRPPLPFPLWSCVFPSQSAITLMPLVEAVQAPSGTLILLPFLRWQDCLSLGAASTLFFNSVKAWVEERSTDISSGASPCAVPCESACHQREGRSESSRGKWCMGGPLPPSFKYLNESVHLMGTSNNGSSDLLQGCSCQTGNCKEGVEDGSPCPCVQLNASVQRWGEADALRR